QGVPPTALAVQSALNDLPDMANLGGPLSVSSSTTPAGVTTYNVIYARSETQRMTITPNSAGAFPTGGTFTLTVPLNAANGRSVTTGPITYSAAASTLQGNIQSALNGALRSELQRLTFSATPTANDTFKLSLLLPN